MTSMAPLVCALVLFATASSASASYSKVWPGDEEEALQGPGRPENSSEASFVEGDTGVDLAADGAVEKDHSARQTLGQAYRHDWRAKRGWRKASAGQMDRTSDAEAWALLDVDRESAGGLCGNLPTPKTFTNLDSISACEKCLSEENTKNGCVWCPLTQDCRKKGVFSTCKKRDNLFAGEDKDLTHQELCSAAGPQEWIDLIGSAYGSNPGADVKNKDAQRCVEYSMGWPVSQDDNMKGSEESERGRWACISVLVRDALLRSMGHGPVGGNPVVASLLQRSAEQALDAAEGHQHPGSSAVGANSLAQNEATGSQDRRDGATAWDVRYWAPAICSAVLAGSPGADCKVSWYGAQDFDQLRSKDAAPNKADDVTMKIVRALQEGPIVPVRPETGKSGAGVARTWDNKFKVRIGVKSSNEITNLEKLVKGTNKTGAISLFEHFNKNPNSILLRFYGLAQLQFAKFSQYVLLLGDPTYGYESEVLTAKRSDKEIRYDHYDLKGASRDPATKGNNSLLKENGDFNTLEGGQFKIKGERCSKFRDALAADTKYLDAHEMIDYSLFVGVANGKSKTPPDCQGTPGEPFCFVEGKTTYTISLVGYLNEMNWYKSMESTFRWNKYKNYGKQIQTFAEKTCDATVQATAKSEGGNTWIIVLVCVVVFLALGVGGYFLYTKVLKDKDPPREAQPRREEPQQVPHPPAGYGYQQGPAMMSAAPAPMMPQADFGIQGQAHHSPGMGYGQAGMVAHY